MYRIEIFKKCIFHIVVQNTLTALITETTTTVAPNIVCESGYQGAGCQLKECPATTGEDYCNAANNQGTCDTITGECICASNYQGDACQQKACPATSGTDYCNAANNQGTCNIATGECTCTDGYTGTATTLADSSCDLVGMLYQNCLFVTELPHLWLDRLQARKLGQSPSFHRRVQT